MVKVLKSSLLMVPVPTADVLKLAATAGASGVTVPRVTVKVSLFSTMVSPE